MDNVELNLIEETPETKLSIVGFECEQLIAKALRVGDGTSEAWSALHQMILANFELWADNEALKKTLPTLASLCEKLTVADHNPGYTDHQFYAAGHSLEHSIPLLILGANDGGDINDHESFNIAERQAGFEELKKIACTIEPIGFLRRGFEFETLLFQLSTICFALGYLAKLKQSGN